MRLGWPPQVIKGAGLAGYVQKVHLASTMGRSVPVQPSSLAGAVDAFRQQAAKQQP